MFVQVIKGKVSDPERVKAALDRWMDELSPGAPGWLGTTAGVTEDGRLIALARFESEEVARQNNDRPEQDQWWRETAQLFDGEPTFAESSDVDVDMIGDPDSAGFVQIMEGRSTDPDRAQGLMQQDSGKWAEFRPDVIGSLVVPRPDGAYTMALYFTSEAEAREGEKKEPPPELKAQMEEMNALSAGEPDYFDLKQPWLYSPR
jgi:hypothetical protein